MAELQSRGRMSRVEKLHLHRVPKRQPRTSENEQPKGKRVVQRTSRIPKRSWPNGCARSTSSCEMFWKLDQTSWWRHHSCWQKVLRQCKNASINIEQHGHVKVRSLHQWRPVLSRYGMRGLRVGEASNPGPVTTRSASCILATQVDSSRIE